MKVVLFCGGLGMRLRDSAESVPKPLASIGYRPLLWYVMKYYAHYGHKDFILCLGYKGDMIKNYFLTYNECLSNDFILSNGGREVTLLHSDIQDWRITFADTGTSSNIGQRLRAIEHHLDGEEMFLANYADGLTDLPLPDYLDYFRRQDKIASFLCIRPTHTFHVVSAENGVVNDIQHIANANVWVNGGYFIFRREIFRYIHDGEELVEQPFQRLMKQRQLLAYKYTGFWACIDTYKDRQHLEDLYAGGQTPWQVWKPNGQVSSKA
jgi:glucose-1-phosphate cytidylyltransferase